MKTLKKTQNRIPKDCGITTEGITYIQWEYQEKKGIEEIFEAIMTENFTKLMLDTKPQVQES